MRSLNKVTLIGRLGKDPEIQRFDDNVMVARFSIATSETYKDKTGNMVESTEWHNIVVWRKLGEIAEKFLKKGSQIYLEGKLRTRSWDDKDGNKRYTTEIQADNFIMLDKKSETENSNIVSSDSMPAATPSTPAPAADTADDLPF